MSLLLLLEESLCFSLHHKNQLEKQAELERNREYEVSLVNTLKNSYRDIEEIKTSDPMYTEKPGSWSCTVAIKFINGELIEYRIGHYLDWQENYEGRMNGGTSEEINAKWEKLYSYKGETASKVKVIYSDSTEGEQ